MVHEVNVFFLNVNYIKNNWIIFEKAELCYTVKFFNRKYNIYPNLYAEILKNVHDIMIYYQDTFSNYHDIF